MPLLLDEPCPDCMRCKRKLPCAINGLMLPCIAYTVYQSEAMLLPNSTALRSWVIAH